jgi:Transposase DDE domain
MDLQLWKQLSSAVSDVQQHFKPRPRDVHSTACIVRVHLWSVLHDRPTCWACERFNWTRSACPVNLPDQSTMSRRMRRDDFEAFLKRLSQRLNGPAKQWMMKIVDGKPLELSHNSTDRDAAWGHGVSHTAKGYKLHMIHSGNHMPDDFVITPMNTSEKDMAARMIKRVGGGGYLLADANYDANWFFDHCTENNYQLLCPRARPGTALGHHKQSDARLRSIDLLEHAARINAFGPTLYCRRTDIERKFSNLVCFGGGLTTLPPWVRRMWRVRRWVWGKLLVNAARNRIWCKRAVGA